MKNIKSIRDKFYLKTGNLLSENEIFRFMMKSMAEISDEIFELSINNYKKNKM